MKKKLLVLFSFLIIGFIVTILIHPITRADSIDEISNLHVEDFNSIIKNRDFNKENILNSSKIIADKFSKFLPENRLESAKNAIVENSYMTIVNEWMKIVRYKIDMIKISGSVHLNSIESKLVSEDLVLNTRKNDIKIIIIKAQSRNVDKYHYIYVYTKDKDKNQYKINGDMGNYIKVNNSIYNEILKYFTNDSIKWCNLDVKYKLSEKEKD